MATSFKPLEVETDLETVSQHEIAPTHHRVVSTPCDCYHDYQPLEHYLSLPTVNVLAGDAQSQVQLTPAEPCFRSADWIAAIRGESPEGYVPPSTRYLCGWCKDHWASVGSEANRFEPLR